MAVVCCRSCGRYNLAEELKQRCYACELCGQIIPVSDRPPETPSPYDTLAGSRQQATPVRIKPISPISSWDLLDWYRVIRWLAGALFCFGLGVVLIFSPALRTNPKALTASDAMPGVAAIIVGIGMLVLFLIPFFRLGKAPSSTSEQSDTADRPRE